MRTEGKDNHRSCVYVKRHAMRALELANLGK